METTREKGPAGEPEAKPLLLMVGGGGVGRELLRRVLPHWRVSVVERDPEAAERIRRDFGCSTSPDSECSLREGDASSSLVLEEAGIEEADVVAVTTSDNRLNREVCRIAEGRFRAKKVVSLIRGDADPLSPEVTSVEWVETYDSLARLLEREIHSGTRGNLLFESEGGQIQEVTVMAGSPVVGRSLGELNAQTWSIAAVFREKSLILPRPDTRLETGDRVLLVGHREILETIAEYMRIGVSEFPRRYGDWLLIPVFCEPEAREFFDEALYLAQNTSIRGVELFCWAEKAGEVQEAAAERLRSAGLSVRTTAFHDDPVATVLEAVESRDIGCLVLPPPACRSTSGTIGRGQFRRLLEVVCCPILVARGTHPYERILVPVTDTEESLAAAELALDLARLLGSKTSAASILPPSFSVGEAALRSQKEALEKTLSLANLYRTSIEDLEQEGNPVREILKLLKGFNLLVVSHRRGRRWRILRPDISHHLIGKASASVLVVEMGNRGR